MSIEKTYMSSTRYAGLCKYDLEDRSLYDFLKQEYNVYFINAYEKFNAVSTNKYESVLLDYPAGYPSILIERTLNEANSIIYSKAIIRGDKFSYIIELK